MLLVGLGLAAPFAGCTFTVDTAELSDTTCRDQDGNVDLRFKPCGDACVRKDNPNTGCALLGCAPCVIPHATANCGANGQCETAACSGSYEDCDGNVKNGCEVDLDHGDADVENCGKCGAPACETENGTPTCSAGKCGIARCTPGFDNCDNDVKNGCEAVLATDSQNCGICSKACVVGQECVGGSCITPAPAQPRR